MKIAFLLGVAALASVDGACTITQELGCFADENDRRLLSYAAYFTTGSTDVKMTHELCAEFCCAAGYTGGYSGVEYKGYQCFCGKTFDASKATKSTACTDKCEGNSTQACGGSNAITISKGKLMPEYVLQELDQRIARGEISEAVEFCAMPENYCMASDVVLAGLERFQASDFGFAEYKAAVEEAGEDHTGSLYRKTEVLGVIGAIAPMLGLTGTVLGMISAFNELAVSDGMAEPTKLAGGIGQALITTLFGLVVAIPTMVAYSFFRNKIDSIVAEAGKRIERIMMPLGRKR